MAECVVNERRIMEIAYHGDPGDCDDFATAIKDAMRVAAKKFNVFAQYHEDMFDIREEEAERNRNW